MTYDYRETSGQIGSPPKPERELYLARSVNCSDRSGSIPSSQDRKQGGLATRLGDCLLATFRNGAVEVC